MTEQEAQAALLAAYRAALAGDPAAPPPDGLDPALAVVARRLAREPAGAEPAAAFVADLARRLGLPDAAAPAPPGDRLPGPAPVAPRRPPWLVLRGGGAGRRGARARDAAS